MIITTKIEITNYNEPLSRIVAHLGGRGNGIGTLLSEKGSGIGTLLGGRGSKDEGNLGNL